MKLIILGAPGAGKGTQAEKITKHYNIPHISTGAIFRENIKNKTQLGVEVSKLTSKGILVPDNLTNQIVKDRLSNDDCSRGFMLDGFPRTINQAKALDEFGILIDSVIYINVDTKTILERMCGRLTCPKCYETYHKFYNPPNVKNICDNCGVALIQRDDDNEETVIKRLQIFHKESQLILEFYYKKNLVIEVSGIGKPDDIARLIIESLEKR